jgi:adenylate cyclase class IV
MPDQKTIEVEFRALLSETQYRALEATLAEKAEDLGADDKRVWFFVMPDKLLKVTHNISKKNGKVTLKMTQLGGGSAFEEIEYYIAEESILKAVEVFQKLGHEYLLEPSIPRHNYSYKGVELALKFSKSWGYHVELEIVINDASQHVEAEEHIAEVAHELDIQLMSDLEVEKFSKNVQDNYVHPPEVNDGIRS